MYVYVCVPSAVQPVGHLSPQQFESSSRDGTLNARPSTRLGLQSARSHARPIRLTCKCWCCTPENSERSPGCMASHVHSKGFQ